MLWDKDQRVQNLKEKLNLRVGHKHNFSFNNKDNV